MQPILYIGAASVVGVGFFALSGSADASIQGDTPVGDAGAPSVPPFTYPAAGATGDAVSTSNMSAFLASVREYESAGQYNALVGGGSFSDYTRFPVWSGWHNSHAAGAYQFQPATWAWVARECSLTDFSPDSQDIGAEWLANFYARDAIAAGDITSACAQLASQWESIKTKGGKAYAVAFTSNGGSLA